MKQASFIIGIVTIVGMFIGLIPCLGWFNWFNLPLAIVGLVLGIIAYNNERQAPVQYDPNTTYYRKNSMPIGIILNAVAFGFGFIRLFLGGGIF